MSISCSEEKLLFVDLDGVTHPLMNSDDEVSNALLFGEEQMREIARVVEETQCSVILSSSWRMFDSTYLRAQNEFSKFDMTIKGRTSVDKALTREEQIFQYVKEHGDPQTWAVVDDAALGFRDSEADLAVRERFVKTDCKVGITELEANQLIK